MKLLKNNVVRMGIIAIVVFGLIFGIVTATQNAGKKTNTGRNKTDVMSTDDAIRKMEELFNDITVNYLTPKKGEVLQGDDEGTTAVLPDISAYEFVVNPTTENFLTIYSSTEKAGTGYESWLADIAEQFNKSGVIIDGKPVSVGVRSIPSGLGADFISSGKYTPDVYMPSSELYGDILTGKSVKVNLAEKRIAGNVTGIVLSKKANDTLTKKYNSLDAKIIIESILNNELVIGYVNPLSDSDGLNFILTALYVFDTENPLSETSVAKMKQFQDHIPFVSYDTTQLKESAVNGTLDGIVSDYQAYINSSLKSDYIFIPFGVRQDQPVYEIGELSDLKKQITSKFVDYCKTSEAQNQANAKGFNNLDDYNNNMPEPSGTTVIQAQELWKKEKNGSSDLTAVFVADISGSMEGSPMLKLKASLNRSSTFIDSNTNIGLVTFSDTVNIALPIAKFDQNQKAYFANAVKTMTPGGGTAMFDAVVVAQKMLMDAKEKNPNTKLMLFVLTDGESNRGYTFQDIEKVSSGLRIQIYTIGYNADIEVLKKLSDINEAITMSAETDDVIQKLQGLFNALA